MKGMKASALQGLTFGLLLLLAGACNDTDCTVSNTAYVNYGLYNGNGVAVTFTEPVTVTTTGVDSVLINQESNMQLMQLPLSYTNTEDTFIVHLSETLFDTIYVTHQNIPYFTNLDCGTMMFYNVTNTSFTQHVLDSLTITNPNIDNNEKENFKIYYTNVAAGE